MPYRDRDIYRGMSDRNNREKKKTGTAIRLHT